MKRAKDISRGCSLWVQVMKLHHSKTPLNVDQSKPNKCNTAYYLAIFKKLYHLPKVRHVIKTYSNISTKTLYSYATYNNIINICDFFSQSSFTLISLKIPYLRKKKTL